MVIESVDLSCCGEARSFLQSPFWGSFKARFGWNARAFRIRWEGYVPTLLLVIRRRLGPTLSFAYVPWGPELPAGFPADDALRLRALTELAAGLKPLLPANTAFVRFDPPWHTEGGAPPPPLGKPFVRAAADVQPPDTVIIDLGQSKAEIMAGMKSKWRYNARLAMRKGITLEQHGETGVERFYRLLRETAARDGIAIHDIGYYRSLFQHSAGTVGRPVEIRLYMAAFQGEDLAAIVVLLRGEDAVYLYGASSNQKRNFMAPYALQVRAMEDAKAAGCLRYDLFGIPPSDDPAHPMAGLYLFKTGFGGTIVRRPGSWDYVYRPFSYNLFRAAEALRKKLRTLRKRGAQF